MDNKLKVVLEYVYNMNNEDYGKFMDVLEVVDNELWCEVGLYVVDEMFGDMVEGK